MKSNESVVCAYSRCKILISGKIIKEKPGSVASGTLYTNSRCRPIDVWTVGWTLSIVIPYYLLRHVASISDASDFYFRGAGFESGRNSACPALHFSLQANT